MTKLSYVVAALYQNGAQLQHSCGVQRPAAHATGALYVICCKDHRFAGFVVDVCVTMCFSTALHSCSFM